MIDRRDRVEVEDDCGVIAFGTTVVTLLTHTAQDTARAMGFGYGL